ncbi:helix-turn-helix domain-containing protein [Pedobacter gandavensis]|uniref:Helix-turn-helix domain-containing protein n=1 Tax=Pedobacter gandavensis TaxID=2679963 RepID=A0ABR6EVI4_9SPHI|nr:helix-turn-helix domain-containing protein [Pedobacter gandavensis]MBB2149280.1 helix-turn-helix domain-containing protein [Pedobacter gandavensis]
MHLKEIIPHEFLSSFVRCYRIIDFEFPDNQQIPAKVYTPRPEQCLQFFPSLTKIAYEGRANDIVPKNAILFGQHSIVNTRTVYARFLSFQVVFQPGALYKLLGMSADLITNEAVDATDIFGLEIEEVNDQLFHSKSHLEMVTIVEAFIIKKIKVAKKEAQRIDHVAILMTSPDLSYSLDGFVSQSFLSHRQFNRKFIERTGISPKAFLRIKRFDQAYRMKNNFPELSWFKIAINCGYEDYQHLSKDYKDLTGLTPIAFFAMESPERLLGSEETY